MHVRGEEAAFGEKNRNLVRAAIREAQTVGKTDMHNAPMCRGHNGISSISHIVVLMRGPKALA